VDGSQREVLAARGKPNPRKCIKSLLLADFLLSKVLRNCFCQGKVRLLQ
jgi:hypothetical protein